MIYAVERFENYNYKVNAVLKRLKMTILTVMAEIFYGYDRDLHL